MSDHVDLIKQAYLESGDAEGNAKRAMHFAQTGETDKLIEVLTWMAEQSERAARYAHSAIAKVKGGA